MKHVQRTAACAVHEDVMKRLPTNPRIWHRLQIRDGVPTLVLDLSPAPPELVKEATEFGIPVIYAPASPRFKAAPERVMRRLKSNIGRGSFKKTEP
jgi:hypothetical protein